MINTTATRLCLKKGICNICPGKNENGLKMNNATSAGPLYTACILKPHNYKFNYIRNAEIEQSLVFCCCSSAATTLCSLLNTSKNSLVTVGAEPVFFLII